MAEQTELTGPSANLTHLTHPTSTGLGGKVCTTRRRMAVDKLGQSISSYAGIKRRQSALPSGVKLESNNRATPQQLEHLTWEEIDRKGGISWLICKVTGSGKNDREAISHPISGDGVNQGFVLTLAQLTKLRPLWKVPTVEAVPRQEPNTLGAQATFLAEYKRLVDERERITTDMGNIGTDYKELQAKAQAMFDAASKAEADLKALQTAHDHNIDELRSAKYALTMLGVDVQALGVE